jgi:polar amino acid transport system substrate-binding protein
MYAPRRSAIPFAALAAAALTLSACGSGGDAEHDPYGLIQAGTITAATEPGQPPFAYADGSGKPIGFIVDVTGEVARRLKLKVDYKSTTVVASLAGLTSGQYDLAASGLGVTPERQKSVDFTKPLFWSTTAVLTKKTSTISSLTGFGGKKVGVVTGSAQEPFIPAKMPGAGAVRFQTENAAVSQLLSGNIDAFVVGGPDATQFMKQYAALRLAVSAPVDHPTSMAVRKNHAAFLTAVDQQLAAMVTDGTYARLYKRYFTTPPLPQLVTAWPALSSQFHGAA